MLVIAFGQLRSTRGDCNCQKPAAKAITVSPRAFNPKLSRLQMRLLADFNTPPTHPSVVAPMATTPKGTEIEERFTKLGLSQLSPEPPNFEPHTNPSCIDLVVTDQPNIIVDSGTRASLNSYCHPHIVYCKVNYKIPPLPFERNVCQFNRSYPATIKRSMTSLPWSQELDINTPNWQVKPFTGAITSWNDVNTHFVNIPSFNILKDHILSLTRKKKKYFWYT